MFAAKLIALVVAFMAVAQVDAKKRKHHSRHQKKERVRSAVTRNCGAETASIVIDGLSQNLKTTKERIRDFPTDIPLTIALGPEELRSRKLIKYINFAIENKVTLAYRFRDSYDRHFERVSPARLTSTLESAKKVFMDQYNYELTNVFFPSVRHHLTKQTQAVEEAGYTVFGNSVDVKKNFGHNSRSKVKSQFKKYAKKGLGTIVYLDGHGNKNLLKDLDLVFDMLRYHKFNVVDLETCFASIEVPEEEPAAEQAAAVKAETEQTGGAVGFGFSGLLAAAVALVAFAL